METETKKKRTRADIEHALNEKKDQIEQRLASLQEEVATVGPSIKKAVFEHPLVSVAGALLAGLVVGLIAGGRKDSRRDSGPGADHRALVDHYVSAVVDEARHRMAKGQDVDAAVREALHERVPLIVYEVPEGETKTGMFGLLMGLAMRQLVPLGIEMGMGLLQGENPAPVSGDEQ